MLPNGRAFVFKERTWKKTLADEVARQIVTDSYGMRIVETFCDPSMLFQEGQTFSIGDIFENNGVPLTAAKNDRTLFGYSINQYLMQQVDGLPKLQILRPRGTLGCPNLIRTLPRLRMNPQHPDRVADGDDHWAVALRILLAWGRRQHRVPDAGNVLGAKMDAAQATP